MIKDLPEGYTIDVCWGALDAALLKRVTAFLNANALKDPARAEARAKATAALAYDAQGNIVAHMSVRASYLKQLLNRFWAIAVYVDDANRQHGLPGQLNIQVRDFFEARFLAGKDPEVIGTSMTMQSPIYRKARTEAVTSNSGALFIGRNGRGHDVRVYYFNGALIEPVADDTPSPEPREEIKTPPARIEICWERRDEPELQQAVLAFFEREKVFDDPQQAQERVKNIAALAFDAQDNIVAEFSVEKRFVKQLDNWLWYIATYVSPSQRRGNLSPDIAVAVRDYLEARFLAGEDPAVIGLFAVMQTRAFKSRRNLAVTERAKMAFLGRNSRGDNMRVYYFKGAHIDHRH